MNSEDPLDALLAEAKASPVPHPSQDLISRVLADAASAVPGSASSSPATAPKLGFFKRLFGPIGGYSGAFALSACATFGVVAGAGYADTVLTLPGLETVLSAFGGSTDSTTPFETLALLMSES